MGYLAEPYGARTPQVWNDFVERSDSGTIFHRLDFLSYHGQRFAANERHLAILKGSSLFGVMPMGVFEESSGRRVARSPYGASYGGPVFAEPLDYATSREVTGAIVACLREWKVSQLVMTLPIAPCCRRYCETFRLALLEAGFACTNRDISSVVDLRGAADVQQVVTSRARNMSRKAQKLGVKVVERAGVEEFWAVMEATFRKHGKSPAHSLEEFRLLHERFPQRIWVDVAALDGTAVAGVGYVAVNARVNSSFYLCQDPAHQSTQAQSLLVCHALEQSKKAGYAWFDFGTSSRQTRGVANIFHFKESFGAVGFFRETYTWSEGAGP